MVSSFGDNLTNMKKLLIISSLVLLAAAGCNKTAQNNSPSNNNQSSNSNTPSLNYSNTDNWLTYTNNQLGFQFKYPPDWQVVTATADQAKTGLIVSFKSPQTQQMNSPQNDLEVSEWSSINNQYAIGGSYQHPTYTHLTDLINDPNAAFIKKTADTTIAGHPAYDVTIGGAGSNDGVMFEHNGIYQLSFLTISGGKYINGTASNVEDLIASSWIFTK